MYHLCNHLFTLGGWFNPKCAVVIKHNNPCGAACSSSLAEATKAAMAGDPLSAFGSILGMNRKVDAATAEVLAEPGLFVEAIIAPEFDSAAFEILTTKPKWKNNVRLLQIGTATGAAVSKDWRRIDGGLLESSHGVTTYRRTNA